MLSNNVQKVHKGFYLSPKRRKLGMEHKEEKIQTPVTTTLKQLPPEIIAHILKFISYKALSDKIRMLNRQFQAISENILNRAFKKLGKKMIKLIATFLEVTKTTQNDSQLKIYCKLVNILEFLNTEHALTMATIWRYVYNDYYKTETSSMYAGLLLDKLEALLSKISKSPLDAFKVSTLSHEHLPKEVSNVISMNKTFCNFFDRTNEYAARHALVHSGSKIADILECANFATKTIVYEKCIENLFTAKYVYFFKRSWFIAFPMENVLETSRKTKQKMMHLRLRRMVCAHNLMFMPQAQYDRECLIRPNGNVLEPHPNVYTGYGDKEDILFFYGVMNDGAYRLKYQDDLDDDDEERPEIIEGSPSDRIPNLGLCVELSIDCPIKYSPLKFLKSLPQEKIRSMKNNNEVCGTKIQLKCVWEGAKRLRLEEEYNYNFTSMI